MTLLARRFRRLSSLLRSLIAVLLAGVILTGCDLVQSADAPDRITLDDETIGKVQPAPLPDWMHGVWQQERSDKDYFFRIFQSKEGDAIYRFDEPNDIGCYWMYEGEMLGMVDGYYLLKREYHLEFLSIEGSAARMIVHVHQRENGQYRQTDRVVLLPSKKDAKEMTRNLCSPLN